MAPELRRDLDRRRSLRARRLLPLAAFALLLGAAPPAALGNDEEQAESRASDVDAFVAQAEVIKKKLDADYGEGFFTYFCDDGVMPRPYLVAAEYKENVDRETVEKEYADILGSLYEQFFKAYGAMLGIDAITQPVTVLVFDSKESYEKVFKEKPELKLVDPEFVGGYYRNDTGVLYQWRQADLWHVMFHEGTHQLVDFATDNHSEASVGWNRTPWFSEGIADFLGGHKRKLVYSEEKQGFVNEFTLGQFVADRYTQLQRCMSNTQQEFSLEDYVTMSYMEFKMAQNNQSGSSANQQLTSNVYAFGWAFVKFLNQYDDGKYKELFDEYFRAEVQGRAGPELFKELFYIDTEADWADLESEFRDYVFGDLRRERTS